VKCSEDGEEIDCEEEQLLKDIDMHYGEYKEPETASKGPSESVADNTLKKPRLSGALLTQIL
jgi:hypothetical protein